MLVWGFLYTTLPFSLSESEKLNLCGVQPGPVMESRTRYVVVPSSGLAGYTGFLVAVSPGKTL